MCTQTHSALFHRPRRPINHISAATRSHNRSVCWMARRGEKKKCIRRRVVDAGEWFHETDYMIWDFHWVYQQQHQNLFCAPSKTAFFGSTLLALKTDVYIYICVRGTTRSFWKGPGTLMESNRKALPSIHLAILTDFVLCGTH